MRNSNLWTGFKHKGGGYMTFVFAVVGVVASILSCFIPSLPVAIGALLGIMSFTTWTLLHIRASEEETRKTLERANDTLGAANHGHMHVYETQEAAYEYLVEHIKQYAQRHGQIQQAVMVQYSCMTASIVLKTLVKHGAKVDLYLEDPILAESLGSLEQSDRIKTTLRTYKNTLEYDNSDPNNVTIHRYYVPGSLSAVRIDSSVIMLGWYIYRQVRPEVANREYPQDRVLVNAHNIAAVVALGGTPEYQMLNETLKTALSNYTGQLEPIRNERARKQSQR